MDRWQQSSQLLGYLSVCTWLGAQLPQIYENWVQKSVDGLSLAFLAVWVTGDLTGLIGCILTGQLGFQTVLGCYYLCMDIVLCLQYYIYSQQHAVVLIGVAEVSEFDNSNSNRKTAPVTFRKRLGSLMSLVSVAGSVGRASALPLAAASNNRVSLDFGHFCAYFSTLMYVISRIPQIYRNMKRQSVEGVSPMLFCATLFGNLTYTSSIVCASFAEDDQRAFLLNELSYILGSAGTVLFDVVILSQFYLYTGKQPLTVHHQFLTRLVNKSPVLSHQTIYSTLPL